LVRISKSSQKSVNNHRLKPVVLAGSDFACLPIGGCFHPAVQTGGSKIGRVNNHRLKPVALLCSDIARPPAAVVSIHQLKLVALKSEK
jgi:hypothetical protein